jgi:hypothetical protein
MINTTWSKMELYLLHNIAKNIGAWLNVYDATQVYALKANSQCSL